MGSINGKIGTSMNSLNSQTGVKSASRSGGKPALSRTPSESSSIGTHQQYFDASAGTDADFANAREGKPPSTSPQEALGPAQTTASGRKQNGVRTIPANIFTERSRSGSITRLDPAPMPREASEFGADDNEATFKGADPGSMPNSVSSSPAPSSGHIDDAPPAAASTQTSKPAPVAQPADAHAVKWTNAVLKTAGVLSVELLKGLWSLVKGTYKVTKHPLTQKLVLLGILVGCTATFGALAVVSGGLFGGGLFLLLVPTVAVAGIIIKQDVMPAIINMIGKSQGAA